MVAAGQQNMITILWVYKFKLNEPWVHCMAQMPSIKESERIVYRNPNSTERFCQYEQKKYDFNRFSADFYFMMKLSI